VVNSVFAITSIVSHPMFGIVCDDAQIAGSKELARKIARARYEHYAELYGEGYPREEKEDKHGLVFSGSNGDVDWMVFVNKITEKTKETAQKD